MKESRQLPQAYEDEPAPKRKRKGWCGTSSASRTRKSPARSAKGPRKGVVPNRSIDVPNPAKHSIAQAWPLAGN